MDPIVQAGSSSENEREFEVLPDKKTLCEDHATSRDETKHIWTSETKIMV